MYTKIILFVMTPNDNICYFSISLLVCIICRGSSKDDICHFLISLLVRIIICHGSSKDVICHFSISLY